MIYTQELRHEIFALHKEGHSSRDIADYLGISKSGVNEYLARTNGNGGPRVLFFDLETAPDISATFGRWNVNITQSHIIRQGHWLLSASWSWLGQDTIHGVSLTPSQAKKADDKPLVTKLLSVYDKADIVVAHNGFKFDFPVFRTRLLMNNMAPHRAVRGIDTLRMAKSLKFASNKLDSLGKTMELGSKIEHSGIQLWIDCMRGNKVALGKMLEYNKQDVKLMKEVYYEMAPFYTGAPNFATYYNDSIPRCRTCGSSELSPTGNKSFTNLGKFSEVVCGHCGSRHRTRTNELSVEKRKSILTSA